MSHSEIISSSFDETREVFKPYGLTCELWTPTLMHRPDRHNEIELNFVPNGGVTYLFQDQRFHLPANRLIVFWGLIPHQIVDFKSSLPYYVCTVPFAQFLEWNLPKTFVDHVLKGEIITEADDRTSAYDGFLMQNWIADIDTSGAADVIALEIRARLSRMAFNYQSTEHRPTSIHTDEINPVERIAVYIAQNYQRPIKVDDLGEAVGLHPDYANTLFKKAFGRTLSEYITEERIAHAQRKLVSTMDSITEIAYDSGFNSISRFNSAFRKTNQCTPRAFRKRHLS
jgi:AraC-like DNA-binding protein